MANARNIGATFERDVAHLLTDAGFPAMRGQQRSGTEIEDVICPTLSEFHLECKRHKKHWNVLYKIFQKAKTDRPGIEAPIIFMHAPATSGERRKPVLVAMEYSDFVDLLRGYKASLRAGD